VRAEAGASSMPAAVNHTSEGTAIPGLLREITTSDTMGLEIPLMPSMY